ncbi:DNA-3-methyladenine glycosylase I [Streptomyces sp. NY05-11A]|uniref:DNA-3-methyladenine glycosylase I n=1 Tax=Streptomyces soliscabiei TaxID=588897 RepID=UPI0029BB86F3|nr:DNA-3-methyladenine glycosylase I [Streptomyces sp. NY05-11A]MDX2675384.1 DNA-3-methyladenine glycosylase I [Streptomyces sp. NY05-11A]
MDLFLAPDGRPRCGWAGAAPEFLDYHDTKWGFPVTDDRRLFEKISLEGFQSGLSWRTILAKRGGLPVRVRRFDLHAVADFDESDLERLLGDSGIVRHLGKIEAVIDNARRAIELQDEAGSLAAFFWRHEPDPDKVDPPQTVSTSPASVALSTELKKRGWKFIGPTTVFAFMQAMGLVNDRATDCATRPLASAGRRTFTPPR